MKITAEIIITKAVIRLHYVAKRFKKLEIVKGKLSDRELEQVGRLIPPTLEDMEQYKKRFEHSVLYQPEEKKASIYKQFTDTWFRFYEDYAGFKPRFNATEGKALKGIIKYLTDICKDEDEACQTWEVVLNEWNKLDEFHQKNTDLKYINGNINRILDNVKRLNTTSAKYSSDFKRKVAERFQSD